MLTIFCVFTFTSGSASICVAHKKQEEDLNEVITGQNDSPRALVTVKIKVLDISHIEQLKL